MTSGTARRWPTATVVGYGMTRQHVRALQVVRADGRLLDLSISLLKDNAGFDLKQLFIGSEGTLGVVVSATLATRPAVAERLGALPCPSPSEPGGGAGRYRAGA